MTSFFKVGLLLVSSCVTASAMASIEAIPQWVKSNTKPKFVNLQPQERTRPIVVGDIVYYANNEGKVEAVHRTEGYSLWSRYLPSKAGIDGAFSYGRAKLFVGDLKGNLYALNTRDGSVAWTFKAQSEWLSPPAVVHNRVVAATSSDEIYGLGEADGKEKWHYARRGDEKMTVRGSASPVIFGSDVYAGFSDGYLVALTVAKGKVVWTKKLRTRDRFYDIDMIPAVDDTSVTAATFDGNLYNLERTTGDIKWVFRVGSYGGFLVENDRIFFSGMNGFFYSINKANGSVLWKTAYESGVGMTPARSGNYLVMTTSGDPVYMVDPKDGKIVWKGGLGAGTLASATGQADGWFYTLSNFGNLYAFEIKSFPYDKKGPETIPTPSAIQRIAKVERNTITP